MTSNTILNAERPSCLFEVGQSICKPVISREHWFRMRRRWVRRRSLRTPQHDYAGNDAFYQDGSIVTGLTGSLPVQTTAGGKLTAAAVDLSGAQVTNSLPVNKLNSGTGASATTILAQRRPGRRPRGSADMVTTDTNQILTAVKTFQSSITVQNAAPVLWIGDGCGAPVPPTRS